MNLFSRHKNTVVLATVLLAQFLVLAVQVKRQTAEGPVRVIRLLTVSTLAPFERFLIYSGENVRRVWANYVDLRHVRSENLRLKAESEGLRIDRAREQEDARQARRIQALLEFKEQWIDATVAAQVIGTSGSETSRVLYLDKGTKDGIRADMPVITPDGVVGKVLTVYGDTSQVLLINDPTSGVGATLVNSRLQGIVKGTSIGEVQLNYIMGDEAVQPGEALVTSGGDRIFPKGLPIGKVAAVSMGRNLFLNITLKPAADLNRLEEVLVITQQKPRSPDVAGLGPIRASDILAQHLPGVPQTPPGNVPQQQSAPNVPSAPAATIPARGAPQNPVTPKSQTVVPAVGASAVKAHAAKPASTNTGATTVIQKPPTPKSVTPKPTASPNAGAPKPKPQTAKPALSNAGATTAVQKPSTPKSVTPKPASPNAVVPKPRPQMVKPTVSNAGATTAGQKPSTPKSVTPKPASPNAAEPKAKPQTAKPAVTNAGGTAGQRPPASKSVTPKPASPNVGEPKPKSKPRPAATDGTHPQ
jgi:rod shape-determining protein MreC